MLCDVIIGTDYLFQLQYVLIDFLGNCVIHTGPGFYSRLHKVRSRMREVALLKTNFVPVNWHIILHLDIMVYLILKQTFLYRQFLLFE